ncbi:MAG: hypothetical protein M3R30_07470 [Candidatus Eremiobacteraeota bacterium]|nr:hypothetical protein [Candidatus Eremiobacteraeota bacterium]
MPEAVKGATIAKLQQQVIDLQTGIGHQGQTDIATPGRARRGQRAERGFARAGCQTGRK